MDELDPLDPFSEADLAQPDIPFPQQIPSSLPLPRFVLANPMGSLMTAASIALAEPQAEATNPGSVWHPDLCARPCMFFQNGRCTHGSNCAFCHLNHEKRAIHLDKRNRQILKDLSGEEFLQIVLPEVRRKLDELFRSQPHLLSMLAPLMDLQRPRAIQADSRFRSAIRSMMVRQQLHYLLQKLQEDQSVDLPRITQLITIIEQQRGLVLAGSSSYPSRET